MLLSLLLRRGGLLKRTFGKSIEIIIKEFEKEFVLDATSKYFDESEEEIESEEIKDESEHEESEEEIEHEESEEKCEYEKEGLSCRFFYG